jgi:hypothetical protein
MLCNELFMYLVKSGETKRNLAGQTAHLALLPKKDADRLQPFTPVATGELAADEADPLCSPRPAYRLKEAPHGGDQRFR